MKISVVVTTYNSPEWLKKVIWGYSEQTFRQFELVIADDGSSDLTRRTIDELRGSTRLKIQHVWQHDDGFRKASILNRAIVRATADYLVFTDGDCVPRFDFLMQHATHARRGRFLSGGVVRLPMKLSRQLSQEDIASGKAFDATWLTRRGLPAGKKRLLLTRQPRLSALLDWVTPTRATFNGHNSSAWKPDLLRINGFNEDMEYGGMDRELGERLVNFGVRGKQIRHRAACIHLEHLRAYVRPEAVKRNLAIRSEIARSRRFWTARGIKKKPTAQAQDRSPTILRHIANRDEIEAIASRAA